MIGHIFDIKHYSARNVSGFSVLRCRRKQHKDSGNLFGEYKEIQKVMKLSELREGVDIITFSHVNSCCNRAVSTVFVGLSATFLCLVSSGDARPFCST